MNSTQPTPPMPLLFLGHGSPMNAIETNPFTQTLSKLGNTLPTPRGILVISAHWMTKGTWVTSMANPKTIHDFYGFPDDLFSITYPAPGNPLLAAQLQENISDPKLSLDDSKWGLDHGTWSILRHIYPDAKIPIIQLSLDLSEPYDFHVELGKKLAYLRQQGILMIGSGNIVHNLGVIRWGKDAKAYDWAIEFDEWIKQKLEDRDFGSLSAKNIPGFGNTPQGLYSSAGKLSIPTPDHYLPLLYILGAAQSSEELSFIYEGFQNSSISMRCLKIGA